MVGLKTVIGYALPASGALSLARTKQHLRVTHNAEKDLITGYLRAALNYCEEATGIAPLEATYLQTLEFFPCYRDANGVTQSVDVDDLVLDDGAEPAQVWTATGGEWPTSVDPRSAALSLTFTAGYASADDIPPMFLHAVNMLVGHWYANRESVVVGMTANKVPTAVDDCLALCKVQGYGFEAMRS
jgi:hypothetical protein